MRNCLVALAMVIGLGLASRLHPIGWSIYDKSVGDVVYACAVYLVLALIRPRLPPARVASLAAGICIALELFQATGIPARHGRALLVRWVIGTTFAWHDIACYLVGVSVLCAIDVLWLRPRATALPFTFQIASSLKAPPARVWEAVSSPAGIHDELGPWLTMSIPAGLERIDPAVVPTGQLLGRSWIKLFGLLPIDYDDLTLVEVEENRGFLERSPMLTQRLWQHERRLDPVGEGGCRVTDTLACLPRWWSWPFAWLYWEMARAVFRWRHHRLRRRFGMGEAGA